MLYIICPTCGYFIGKKTLEYEKEKEKICSDPELSDEDKEIKISEVILKLNIKRYCCKMRLISYKDIVTIIAPSS
jgi:DNA-directed RNA polymerase subunit N (RpoN/RPB10)